jgi:hypothetical protein
VVFAPLRFCHSRIVRVNTVTDQLPHQGPEKGFCEGRQENCSREDCPIFGTPLRANKDGFRRIRGCGDPVARGTRSRRKGKRAQRAVANKLGIPTGIDGGNEETWRSSLRVEVKEGKQVQAAVTAFRRTRDQSEQARPIGDNRPFMGVVVHDGLEVCLVALDDLDKVASAVLGLDV